MTTDDNLIHFEIRCTVIQFVILGKIALPVHTEFHDIQFKRIGDFTQGVSLLRPPWSCYYTNISPSIPSITCRHEVRQATFATVILIL